MSNTSSPTSHPQTSTSTVEHLVLHVHNFELAQRILDVQIYQVNETDEQAVETVVGFRVLTTDEVENILEVKITLSKAILLCQNDWLLHMDGNATEAPEFTTEDMANSLLGHLDIIGNPYRDIGRLVCNDPIVVMSKKERVVPTKDSKQQRTKPADKRVKRSSLRAFQAFQSLQKGSKEYGGMTSEDESYDGVQEEEVNSESDSGSKRLITRKTSDMGLLSRMANASPTTVWRGELEGIQDEEAVDYILNEEQGTSEYPSTSSPLSSPLNDQTNRANSTVKSLAPRRREVLNRKVKHPELQTRRDKERNQRMLANMRQATHSDTGKSVRQSQKSPSASKRIINVSDRLRSPTEHTLKRIPSSTSPEPDKRIALKVDPIQENAIERHVIVHEEPKTRASISSHHKSVSIPVSNDISSLKKSPSREKVSPRPERAEIDSRSHQLESSTSEHPPLCSPRLTPRRLPVIELHETEEIVESSIAISSSPPVLISIETLSTPRRTPSLTPRQQAWEGDTGVVVPDEKNQLDDVEVDNSKENNIDMASVVETNTTHSIESVVMEKVETDVLTPSRSPDKVLETDMETTEVKSRQFKRRQSNEDSSPSRKQSMSSIPKPNMRRKSDCISHVDSIAPTETSFRASSNPMFQAMQQPTLYHTNWHHWIHSRQIVDKLTCFQLEQQVLEDPHQESSLIKLGMRYTRFSATSLAAILLFEHASILHGGGSSTLQTREYWYARGNAHFELFLRHRKFLSSAQFHLNHARQAYTRTFAYFESYADPLLLLRYAIVLYWKHEIERAHEIVTQLFSKFSRFCQKEEHSILFLYFQILCQEKLYLKGLDILSRVLERESSFYDRNDYLLMMTHCYQESGDYLSASTTMNSVLKAKNLHSDGTLSDHECLQLWLPLGEKCFIYEDYTLALTYFTIAMTFARESYVLAHIIYHRGLCYQAMGDLDRCMTELKRAKNVNRHVVRYQTVRELKETYDDQFAQLLKTPIPQIIQQARVILYDTAVVSVQRLFRQKQLLKPMLPIQKDENDISTVVSTIEKRVRHASIDTSVLLPVVVSPIVSPDTNRLTFEQRKQMALKQLQTLLDTSKSNEKGWKRYTTLAQSGFLSPEKHRLDRQRRQAMKTCLHLGYVPTNVSPITYWQHLITLSLFLYETRDDFIRLIVSIRTIHPLVTQEMACCALAECMGNKDQAIEKLCDTIYERELLWITSLFDISHLINLHFTQPVRFPILQSPPRSSTKPKHHHEHVTLPSPKHSIRLSNMIQMEFTSFSRPNDE